jgi:pimeloyl-ACP methyl ester carboxylesterase
LERFVTDLADLLDEWAPGRPVHLVGNSFGGTVAFGLAEQQPARVASILAIESEPASPAWADKLDGILKRAEAELVRPTTLAWVAAKRGAHTARLARSAGKLLAATTLARDIPASRLPGDARLAAIRCPVLAVYGTESDLAEQAAWLEGLLPNCRSTFVCGQEHSVLVEAPDTVLDLTLDWLREHGVVLRGAAACNLQRSGR